MDTVGIKLVSNDNATNYMKIIRRYSNYSISELKKRIEEREYILECDYVKEEEISTILKLHHELIEAGALTELYEHNRITSELFLKNLIESYISINSDTEKMIDDELQE